MAFTSSSTAATKGSATSRSTSSRKTSSSKSKSENKSEPKRDKKSKDKDKKRGSSSSKKTSSHSTYSYSSSSSSTLDHAFSSSSSSSNRQDSLANTLHMGSAATVDVIDSYIQDPTASLPAFLYDTADVSMHAHTQLMGQECRNFDQAFYVGSDETNDEEDTNDTHE